VARSLFSGNEAIALGAYAGGASFGSGYPGTPSTEILERFSRLEGVYAEWAPNEKVALEAAFGASLAGARSLVTMKHVGLNVAADPLFTIAYTGVDAGLVIVTGDDPGMYSSQNEQDNRAYARAARVPMLEPSTPQEAYDMAGEAFELSEAWDTPVLLRTVTRLAHSKRMVQTADRQEPLRPSYTTRIEKYVMVPGNAKRRRADLDERLARALAVSEADGGLNRIEWRDLELGIITSGVAYTHVREALPEASILKLGLSWPLPKELIRTFAAGVARLAVVEELDPILEHDILAMGIALDRIDRPMTGPLDPADIRVAFGGERCVASVTVHEQLPARPPMLCPGCPHRAVFYALHRRKAIVMGDIGCYTLGAMPPLAAMDTCVCMGASVGAAHGFTAIRQAQEARGVGESERAGGSRPVFAVIGDSTFLHSGITGLLDIAYNGSATPVLILDNRTTAMTGRQPNPATGQRIGGDPSPAVDFEELAHSLGVAHTETMDPSSISDVDAALDRALAAEGPSLVVFKRPCVLLERPSGEKLGIDADACGVCGRCSRLGCPAIYEAEDGQAMAIDVAMCTGCGLCAQVCRDDAIRLMEPADARA
jgi:indolepyruvate ferredoxin oxidoreductase, alpha subunit